MKTIPFDQVRAEILSNPAAKAEYDRQTPAFAIAEAVIRARLAARMTQAQLATRMGAKQPFIARIESGGALPSVQTMMRIAIATGTMFQPVFVPAKKREHV